MIKHFGLIAILTVTVVTSYGFDM